ncbi:MAG: nickel-dependent lactate racemase, partial [Atribacterota bacterium]|nr:nickel-dependent lactate racemase [Atribacterota bacterium]MDD4895870.1 nickel-dependent lactate racemase [Atribacterota bacterium]
MKNSNIEFGLKYGDRKIELKLEEKNIIAILSNNKTQILKDPLVYLEKLLDKPINSLSLKNLIVRKKTKKILIIVNDITRPTPFHVLLPPLLTKLSQIGVKREDITFLIATGAHRGNTEEENIRIFGDSLVSSYHFINHLCDDEKLIDLGRLKSGNRLLVNSIVEKVDFIITTGVIVPHYIAGFSGGRKSILPGICGRETIERNHAYMLHPNAVTGNIEGNPVHEEMMEAAQKVKVDFNINAVTDENGNIIDIVAGTTLTESWLQGVEICSDTYICSIRGKADVVLTSAGGYPKDINIYQAQKALDNAYQAVKPGGTIVLVAECREGLGNTVFEKWIEEAQKIDDIEERLKKGFILGGHKAYAIAKVAKEVDIILLSSLSKNRVKKLFMIPAADMKQALSLIQEKHGNGFQCYIMPSGSIVLPQTKNDI